MTHSLEYPSYINKTLQFSGSYSPCTSSETPPNLKDAEVLIYIYKADAGEESCDFVSARTT